MLRVNPNRLRTRLTSLAAIATGPDGRISRLALTDEDKMARDQLVKWMQELSLDVRVDDIGNIYGRRAGHQTNGAAVLIGSHIDTVPNGGMFDGAMGVMAGLEIIEVLNNANMTTTHPIEIVAFTNEEGARFEPVMMGSGAVTGALDTAWVETRPARDTGATFTQELERIGYKGDARNRISSPQIHAYLEYHVEQGPVLERERAQIGVVEGVVGLSWLNVIIDGEANHAGTTPMDGRRDALVAAGRMISAARDLALERGDGVVITIGRITVSPNVPNAVPSRVEFSVDIRHQRAQFISRTTALLEEQFRMIASCERTTVEIKEIKSVEPAVFDSTVIQAIIESAKALEVPYREIVSGAAHDAQYVNAIAPAGMIFVPSRAGMSHSPDEWTDWEDVAAGADILLGAVVRLAG